MSQIPNPLNKQNLSKATLIAAVMAVGGIALFFVIWMALADLNQFARLMLAMCVPPGVMAALVGGYLLLVQPKRAAKDKRAPKPAETELNPPDSL